nr:hypothetical protein RVX_2145 [Nitratidesulfovibrio sp. HK-II]
MPFRLPPAARPHRPRPWPWPVMCASRGPRPRSGPSLRRPAASGARRVQTAMMQHIMPRNRLHAA